MPEISLKTEITRFRLSLLQISPFYGTLLMNVPIIEDRDIVTACTDGRRIRYNPRFMATLTEPERRFVLMHELMHILLMHPIRMKGRDAELYNIAADIVVNDACKRLADKIHMKPPEQGTYATISPILSTEELYGMLRQDNDRHKQGQTISVRLKYNSSDIKPGGVKVRVVQDLQPGDMTDAQRSALEREIQKMVRNAQKGDPGIGRSLFVPAQVLTLAESRKLPWKVLLREYMTENEDDDASYATPERKYIHMDLILPGYCQSEGRLTELWAFVDSSGSIGQVEMNQFLTQLYRISRQFHCTMHIAYWDTAVTDVYRSITGEKRILECVPRHSGGTDINCVYKWMREEHVKPDVMLILTDGEYGRLRPEYHDHKLSRRTILVLSPGASTANRDDVGRVAAL